MNIVETIKKVLVIFMPLTLKKKATTITSKNNTGFESLIPVAEKAYEIRVKLNEQESGVEKEDLGI